MYCLDYHGDDYAISKRNCIRFVELMKAGKIDSISVIPNMSYFSEGMDYLTAEWEKLERKPLISVHIDLMDGFSLSKIRNPFLTKETEAGIIMSASWGKLFLQSFLPGRRRTRVREELTEEIRAQIRRVYDRLPEGCQLRLDSHQHTHMIPLVFDAMMEAVDRENLGKELSFVRVSREPLGMFLMTKGVRGTFPMINVVKNVLLSCLSGRAEKILRKRNVSYSGMWGLVMTGRMDRERVDLMLPKITEYAKKNEIYLEILCHPGIVEREELCPEYGPDDLEAYFAENRNVEYDMLMTRH